MQSEADALNTTERDKDPSEKEGVQTAVSNACKTFIKQFDDPIYSGNAEVAQQKGPMEELAKNLCEGIARMARFSQTMEEFVATARTAAAAGAEAAAKAHVKATQNAKAVAETTLALPRPFRNQSPERGGRKAWADESERGRSSEANGTERADGKSRSPVPAAPKTQGSGSASSKGKAGSIGKGTLPALVDGAAASQQPAQENGPKSAPGRHAGWNKPASERSDEEVLAMALAGGTPSMEVSDEVTDLTDV